MQGFLVDLHYSYLGDFLYIPECSHGYDHDYDTPEFYLELALDPKYVEEFVEGCLERIGEDDSDGGMVLRAGRGDLYFDVRP